MKPQNEMDKKIINAFYEVLKSSSFAKAKDTNITELAGISHQTFYRYYLDKYDLSLKIATGKFSAFHDIYSTNATWKEVVVSMLNSMKNYPVFFKKLLADPEGADIVLQSIVSITGTFTGNRISKHSAAAWISIFNDWGKDDFKAPIQDVYNQMRTFISIKEVLSKEEIEKIMSIYENQPLNYFKTKPK